MGEQNYAMDIEDVKKLIPHRYPFLFVDRVIEIRESGLLAIKNVTGNEAFFQGHFPDYPVMPGVLQIEALAQAGAIFVIHKFNLQNKPVYFMSIDKVRFRSQVVPGDTLKLEIELLRFGGKVAKVRGKGSVEDTVALEADMVAMIDIDM
jgi:3-hydroxyacyl-[acyl-carrier-protein] dehydratase